MSVFVRILIDLMTFLAVWFGLEVIRKRFGTKASIIAAVVLAMACIISMVIS